MFATLATPAGHAFIDVSLYLPGSWTGQADRLAAAGVPEEVEFSTKPQLALSMCDRVLAAGILPGWLTADEAYGDNPELRQELETRGLHHVMAVSRDTQIPVHPKERTEKGTGKTRADDLATRLPATDWHLMSAGKGSKGERLYHWSLTSIDTSISEHGNQQGPAHHRWLLIRRNPHTGEHAYFLCHATKPATLHTLVQVAGTRWRVEENIQAGKGCAALDEHQVRTWTSWHRWTTLAMAAHAFLAVTAARARAEAAQTRPRPQPGQRCTGPHSKELVPLTCNEIRHLKAALARPVHDIVHITRWSRFRRRHQHQAKLCHYHRRQQRDHELLL